MTSCHRRQPGMAALIALIVCAATSADEGSLSFVTIVDPGCDDLTRRTDPGGDGPVDPSLHRPIDLLEITIGAWAPTDAQDDVFAGEFDELGQFVRLDLLIDGLVNPPGSVDPLDFDPFQYGDSPVYGFIEIDMDDDEDTGGEFDAPQFRYLGNIVRFGGMPAEADAFEDRVATDGSAFDGDYETEPFVERHGEEFHLALIGGQFGAGDISECAGDGDGLFEEGERWRIAASWFHRAHGFEEFSFIKGGSGPGVYAPTSELLFEHDVDADTTRVSVVFPLTNVGAGQQSGEPPEPIDQDPTNQASVLEAFDDLVLSALFLDQLPGELPGEFIIIDWKDNDPEDHLDPTEWRITALLGSSYSEPDPAGVFFVWNDAYPNVVRGDVDGEHGSDDDDRDAIEQFIEQHDADDGTSDGRVVIADFAINFSVFDVNHEGVVDATDALLVADAGDMDGDEDVDMADFQRVQQCVAGSGVEYDVEQCALSDLDMDGDVDVDDVKRFQTLQTGPGGDDGDED